MTKEIYDKFEGLQIEYDICKEAVEYVDKVLFEIRDLLALQKRGLNIDSEIFIIIASLVDSTYGYLAQTYTLSEKTDTLFDLVNKE